MPRVQHCNRTYLFHFSEDLENLHACTLDTGFLEEDNFIHLLQTIAVWYKRYLLKIIISTIVVFTKGKVLLFEFLTVACMSKNHLILFFVAQTQVITYLNVILHLLWQWIFICHHFNPSTEGNDRDWHTWDRKNAISDFSVLEVFQQMPFFVMP